jgi:hypothetical protein
MIYPISLLAIFYKLNYDSKNNFGFKIKKKLNGASQGGENSQKISLC